MQTTCFGLKSPFLNYYIVILYYLKWHGTNSGCSMCIEIFFLCKLKRTGPQSRTQAGRLDTRIALKSINDVNCIFSRQVQFVKDI
jgi:hypothetical protein